MTTSTLSLLSDPRAVEQEKEMCSAAVGSDTRESPKEFLAKQLEF